MSSLSGDSQDLESPGNCATHILSVLKSILLNLGKDYEVHTFAEYKNTRRRRCRVAFRNNNELKRECGEL